MSKQAPTFTDVSYMMYKPTYGITVSIHTVADGMVMLEGRDVRGGEAWVQGTYGYTTHGYNTHGYMTVFWTCHNIIHDHYNVSHMSMINR